MLLSAHDAHVAHVSSDPAHCPKVRGAFRRDRFGAGHVSVGTTFDRGSFNATGTDGAIHRFTLGPARPGSDEATLDRVRDRDCLVGLRTPRPPPAPGWSGPGRPAASAPTTPTGRTTSRSPRATTC
ncbi:erythromycin esterase family protein [Streptomyces sp. MMG1121]|uniref:erythromycin esterase family protein n=1 Tax=Streptomyces sp. MMG1121 TaxID=1415544 RepID=UPI0006AEBF62|nr:erythromycin esterase family protein [Streptomyces sp. MMG1121]KOV64721.1 hypothetical protein ADK64_16140 [Streptomyces sp. MMG1121]